MNNTENIPTTESGEWVNTLSRTEGIGRAHEQFRDHPENTICRHGSGAPRRDSRSSTEAVNQMQDLLMAFLVARFDRWLDEHPFRGLSEVRFEVRAFCS